MVGERTEHEGVRVGDAEVAELFDPSESIRVEHDRFKDLEARVGVESNLIPRSAIADHRVEDVEPASPPDSDFLVDETSHRVVMDSWSVSVMEGEEVEQHDCITSLALAEAQGKLVGSEGALDVKCPWPTSKRQRGRTLGQATKTGVARTKRFQGRRSSGVDSRHGHLRPVRLLADELHHHLADEGDRQLEGSAPRSCDVLRGVQRDDPVVLGAQDSPRSRTGRSRSARRLIGRPLNQGPERAQTRRTP